MVKISRNGHYVAPASSRRAGPRLVNDTELEAARADELERAQRMAEALKAQTSASARTADATARPPRTLDDVAALGRITREDGVTVLGAGLVLGSPTQGLRQPTVSDVAEV